jgi:5-formyltetrahydrofolate cyclo-ligase
VCKKRDGMGGDDVESFSCAIAERVLSLDEVKRAEVVMSYFPVKNEVDTRSLIIDLLKSGKRVALPVTNKDTLEIVAAEVGDISSLSAGAFGIPEPTPPLKVIGKDDIDVIIVPAVAFDRNGNRVGYGHGYYDRFLKGARAKIIGIAYEFQIVDNIEPEPHDIKADVIITNNEIIDCGISG